MEQIKNISGKLAVIPAIDIIDGKCVRLSQGNYSRCKIYPVSPLDVAKEFEAAGMKRLHLVDLDGAKSKGVVNNKVLQDICTHTGLEVDFGGGIKSDEDIRKVFDAGAAFACIGSTAQTDAAQTKAWLDLYGRERIIVGADVWNMKICVNGWKKVTDTTIFQLLENYGGRIKYLMCTDIAKDGMLEGPSLELYQKLRLEYPELDLIASGGVRDIGDLEKLRAVGVQSAIVGKAIYEGYVTPEELCRFQNS